MAKYAIFLPQPAFFNDCLAKKHVSMNSVLHLSDFVSRRLFPSREYLVHTQNMIFLVI